MWLVHLNNFLKMLVRLTTNVNCQITTNNTLVFWYGDMWLVHLSGNFRILESNLTYCPLFLFFLVAKQFYIFFELYSIYQAMFLTDWLIQKLIWKILLFSSKLCLNKKRPRVLHVRPSDKKVWSKRDFLECHSR